MPQSTVVLCTLILNEMEWLEKLYAQHRDWPGLKAWIFVESADRIYADINPDMVTSEGTSTDGTSILLTELSESDSRVHYIPYGFSRHEDPAQGKCDSRTQYLLAAEDYRPDFLFVLDADEFYTRLHQAQIMCLMKGYAPGGFTGFCFRHRHPWRPPSIMDHSPFELEVRGGFWDIPLCRGWKWQPGLVYRRNHNTPETTDGRLLDTRLMRHDKKITAKQYPECVHMAFSSSLRSRQAKHRYYAARGEGRTDFRGWYVQSRAAFETWRPGHSLPRRARVVDYDGPIPEVFQQEAQAGPTNQRYPRLDEETCSRIFGRRRPP